MNKLADQVIALIDHAGLEIDEWQESALRGIFGDAATRTNPEIRGHRADYVIMDEAHEFREGS